MLYFSFKISYYFTNGHSKQYPRKPNKNVEHFLSVSINTNHNALNIKMKFKKEREKTHINVKIDLISPCPVTKRSLLSALHGPTSQRPSLHSDS